MAALIIVNYDVDDPDGLDEYKRLAGPLLRGTFGAVGLVNTGETIDLGEGLGAGTNTVVLQFDTIDEARTAWESDDYRAIIGKRFAATTPRFAVMVETR